MMDLLTRLLSPEYQDQLKSFDMLDIEEIRMSVGQPLLVRTGRKEQRVWPKSRQSDLEQLIASACRQSVYAYTDTLRQGFITLEGGHRIGVCGFGVIHGKELHTITSVSSAVIRIARQVFGCADGLFQKMKGSTLLLGEPGSGKTTLLRDLVRQMSDRAYLRIGLADERGEVSAAVHGTPQLQIGMRTDTLVNIPKAEAAMMLLRTMHPQWIAMDEITAPADLDAIEHISYCGVNVLATAHAFGIKDLEYRPLYRRMMQMGVFCNVVLLKNDKTYEVLEVER